MSVLGCGFDPSNIARLYFLLNPEENFRYVSTYVKTTLINGTCCHSGDISNDMSYRKWSWIQVSLSILLHSVCINRVYFLISSYIYAYFFLMKDFTHVLIFVYHWKLCDNYIMFQNNCTICFFVKYVSVRFTYAFNRLI